jgi:CheY-like chemotaxis protein
MKTILIVEDVELNRELLRQLLEDDYLLLTATDGEEAVTITRARHPDLVLMDLSLPRVDGWEATRRIKADPALGRTPVIALTAHAMEGDEERARQCGCDDYISKPIDERLLLEKLETLLSDETTD